MNSSELARKIIDCLSDGYDDEENREEAEEILRDMICNGEENAPEECENSWCDNVQEIN